MALLKTYLSALLLLQFGLQLLDGAEPKEEKGDPGPIVQGPPGNAGPPGPKGDKGDTGLSGGDIMPLKSELQNLNAKIAMIGIGSKGEKGETGVDVQGQPGKPGARGSPGHDGIPGQPGEGVEGPPGPPGPSGPRGLRGIPGPEGLLGVDVQGMPGAPGPAGPSGPRGVQGRPGISGLPGRPGRDVTPQIQHLTAKISMMEKAASFDTFRKVGEKYYIYDGFVATFDEGIKLCNAVGGTIAVARNAVENQALLKVVKTSGLSEKPFIGVTDRETEGQFVDTGGKLLTFTNWASGQPDNYQGTQNCGSIIIDSGFWDDVGCDQARPVICEIENK